MKLLLILIYFMSFLGFLCLGHAIPLPTDEDKVPKVNFIQDQIVRSYVPDGLLTSADEAIILDLAKKRGIERVAEIVTHYMRPSFAKAIRVEGTAEKKGRVVLQKVLRITRKDWTFPEARPGKNDLILGDFWAGKVYVRKQVELNVNGKSYLCFPIVGMTIGEAEALLAMFLKKAFKLSSSVRQNFLDQVDWEQPTHFGKRGESISAVFLAKGREGGFFDLMIKKEKGVLIIHQMMEAMP